MAARDDEGLLRRLRRPRGCVDVVLDTDAYNEIDDQYALALLVRSGQRCVVRGIHAAPFFIPGKSSGPADGMEKSRDEIMRVLSLLGRDELSALVRRGSARYLPSEREAVESEAAVALADLAMNYTSEAPLYVAAIGAITNVASSLLLRPEIAERVVIVWLGGHALDWPDTAEFNMRQDVAAARVVFASGAAVVQLPCMGVVSAFTTSGPELERHLRGKNALCDYLVDYTTACALKDGGLSTWTRALWDVCAVGWLLDGDFMLDRLERIPIPQYDNHYSFDCRRHFYRYVYHINRDALMGELFHRLSL